MSQSEDMEAIRSYMANTAANNAKAAGIRDNFLRWYDQLSWYDRSFNQDRYNSARIGRNDFNLNNAKTPEEKEQVQAVIAKGLTTEQMEGQGDTATSKMVRQKSVPSKAVEHPTLRVGSTGDAVKEWQRILSITDDGRFGQGTKAATKKFQTGHGLTSDGVVGPQTWMAAYVSNSIQTGQQTPGAVIDSSRSMKPALAPKPEIVLKKAQDPKTPMVAVKPIGQPVPARTVAAIIDPAMLDPRGWSTPAKAVTAFFAMLAVFMGFKKARER